MVDRMDNNQIAYTQLERDTIMEVEMMHIKDYQTRTSAYEGHYLHYNTEISKDTVHIQFRKGDLWIPTN